VSKFFLVCGLIVALIGPHLFDLSGRAWALQKFDRSAGADLQGVRYYEPNGEDTCSPLTGGDWDALVRALITVESFATPTIESWWKGIVVHLAAAWGMPVPDLTYGPGRIRLSTAGAVVKGMYARGDGVGVPPDAALAKRLLDYCDTKQIVSVLVSDTLLLQGGDQSHLNRKAIRHVARVYNGQSEPDTPEAAIAHETYNALVYALFQHYRFNNLSAD